MMAWFGHDARELVEAPQAVAATRRLGLGIEFDQQR